MANLYVLCWKIIRNYLLIAKAIINVLKKRKVYKNYTKPKQFDRNMIVIGAGAGGRALAGRVDASVGLVAAGLRRYRPARPADR